MHWPRGHSFSKICLSYLSCLSLCLNRQNKIPSIINLPLRTCSKNSFFMKAVNCFIFQSPPKTSPRALALASPNAVSVFWTVGYVITFGITYGYNAYFWDNHIVQNLFFAAFGYYLVGLWPVLWLLDLLLNSMLLFFPWSHLLFSYIVTLSSLQFKH
mgnify:CR=1 FL=1